VRLLVIGAGGHAKVVIDAARCARIEVAGVIDEPRGRTDLLGAPITEDPDGIDADGFIIAVGDNAARKLLFERYSESGLLPVAVVHPSAIIADGVEIGGGTLVAAGVVVNIDTRIGVNAILNTSCTVDHDCAIEDHAHVGPMTGLCGGVSVGEGALIGAGCSVIPLRAIGEWSVVGAGAAVVADVPAGEVHAGVPARPISSPAE
jgi:sugar O-acyltransferase (sialic acid O-acetyltransferase NeuD family)